MSGGSVTYPNAAQPAERLALIARLSQHFNSSLDSDEVLNRVMDEVIAAVRAERGFVMLYDGRGEASFRVARGMDQRTIEDASFQVSRGVVQRVASSGQPVLTSDAQHDDRFSMRQSIVSLGLRSILCAPLVVRGQVKGAIYVDNRLRAGIFTPDDLDLVVAIASSAAIAIENARLYQNAVETGRLERELQMARELQIGLLPQTVPVFEGWEFASYWKPARQVAGDFFDFIPLGPDRLGFLVADVADKGMPAAIFMALTRSTMRASLLGASSPAEGIARANRLLCADSTGGMFVTLFYAEVNAGGGVRYVNAGHNPALLHRRNGDISELRLTGPLLGFDEDALYTEAVVELDAGETLLLYTDGVTEAMCECEPVHCFGEERLLALMRKDEHGGPRRLVAALDGALAAHVGPAAPYDDITLIAARRTA
jgi:phosphoserine phosphatase RsbU/P